MRPVGEFGEAADALAAARDPHARPVARRAAIALGLAALCWAVPVYVLYLLW